MKSKSCRIFHWYWVYAGILTLNDYFEVPKSGNTLWPGIPNVGNQNPAGFSTGIGFMQDTSSQ